MHYTDENLENYNNLQIENCQIIVCHYNNTLEIVCRTIWYELISVYGEFMINVQESRLCQLCFGVRQYQTNPCDNTVTWMIIFYIILKEKVGLDKKFSFIQIWVKIYKTFRL